MMAPAVAKKGRPRMIGIWRSSSMSRTTKSTGMNSLPTFKGTSSRMPTGNLIDRSASWSDIEVGFGSPMFSFLQMERGIRLTLAPRSQSALLMWTFPRAQGIEKLPGSFSFSGSLFCKMALHSSVSAMVPYSSSFLLLDNISFKNFA